MKNINIKDLIYNVINEEFSEYKLLSLDDLKKKYDNFLPTMEERKPNRYFVSGSIKTQGN